MAYTHLSLENTAHGSVPGFPAKSIVIFQLNKEKRRKPVKEYLLISSFIRLSNSFLINNHPYSTLEDGIHPKNLST